MQRSDWLESSVDVVGVAWAYKLPYFKLIGGGRVWAGAAAGGGGGEGVFYGIVPYFLLLKGVP